MRLDSLLMFLLIKKKRCEQHAQETNYCYEFVNAPKQT